MQRYHIFGFLGSVYAEQAAEAPLCSPWLAGGNAVVDGCSKAQTSYEPAAEEYTLMSIDTIINGKVQPEWGFSSRKVWPEWGLHCEHQAGRVYNVFFL